MASVWQQYGISLRTPWLGRCNGDVFRGRDAVDALNTATQKRLSLHFGTSSKNHINGKTNYQYFSIKQYYDVDILSQEKQRGSQGGVPRNQEVRHHRPLLRRGRARPVSLVGGRLLRGDRQLGEGPERGDRQVPGADSLPREDEAALERPAELPQGGRAVEEGRPLLLLSQRRSAEPERPLLQELP